MKSKILWGAIIVILLGGNLLVGSLYFSATKNLEGARIVISSQRYNTMTLNFMKMFIKKVIKSDKEVDFETRLKLENAVRELNDPTILAQWQKFVNSQAEAEAQKNVKDLLEILIDKVYLK